MITDKAKHYIESDFGQKTVFIGLPMDKYKELHALLDSRRDELIGGRKHAKIDVIKASFDLEIENLERLIQFIDVV